jgi:hypothetical protein
VEGLRSKYSAYSATQPPRYTIFVDAVKLSEECHKFAEF